MKLKFYLLGSTLVAAVAGFLFGFDTVVISGTTDMLTKQFHLSKLMLGVTVSSAPVGTVVGSLVAGKPAEWLGRKADSALAGGALFRLGLGLRLGVELAGAVGLPFHRRFGDRRRFGRRSLVYRRDFAAAYSRAAGGDQSIEHRGRPAGRLRFQLRYRRL